MKIEATYVIQLDSGKKLTLSHKQAEELLAKLKALFPAPEYRIASDEERQERLREWRKRSVDEVRRITPPLPNYPLPNTPGKPPEPYCHEGTVPSPHAWRDEGPNSVCANH